MSFLTCGGDSKWCFVNIGQDKAKTRIWTEYWYDKWMDDKEFEYLDSWCPKGLKGDMKEYIQSRGKQRWKYVFITVNPMPTVTFSEFFSKIIKAVNKVYVKDYYWCIEWREKDQGMHAHFKIELAEGKSPYQVKGEWYNTFKHYVMNKHHIHVLYTNKKEAFIDYIKGKKNGLPKKNAEWDQIMRKKLGLVDWNHNKT